MMKVLLLLLTAIYPFASPAAAAPLTLDLQRRDSSGAPVATPERIDPARTGIVLVDLWNAHHCITAEQRIIALVPRINRALAGARRLGMQVIWAPTDVAEMYAGTPQREAAAALPVHLLPPPLKLDFPAPRGSTGCMCGPGLACAGHWGWDGMNPALTIDARDLIVAGGPHDADRRSERLYAIVKERGLDQLIYMGVHANMCVLNKSVGMAPMTASGVKVILARDMTDALTEYDPARGYTPDAGTAEVVGLYERTFRPSINMEAEMRKAGVWPAEPPVDCVRFAPWGSKINPYLFENSIRVTMTFPTRPGVQIRYTTDGSAPGQNSPLYKEPVTADRTTTFRAYAFEGGRRVSRPITATLVRLPPAPPKPDVYLSSLKPLHQVVAQYSAPEGAPAAPQTDRSYLGGDLVLRGVKYDHGLGVLAPAHLIYELKPEFARFVARAGVDEAMLGVNHARQKARYPSVIFRVFIDGETAAESPVMRVGQEPWRFDVPIPPGSRTITLGAADAAGGNRYDDANWVDAGFL